MQPTLSILVCTINDRVQDVPPMLLEPRPDVMYVVSYQYTDVMFLSMVPPVLYDRSDVLFMPHPTTGISTNRNTALKACHTELAIIADDDSRYTNEQLDMVIRTFREHPDVDIACFKVQGRDGRTHKTYPSYTFDYTHMPKGYFFTSFEIALRCDIQLPQFDTRFGLGSTYLACGEEEIFLYQSHCSGLKVQYFPEWLCTYCPGPTTGELFNENPRVRRSKGAVLLIIHGLIGGFLRIIKTAIHQSNNRWRYFCDMMDGYKYILTSE